MTDSANGVIRQAIAAGLGPSFANTARELANDVIDYLNRAGYTIVADDVLNDLYRLAAT